MKIDFLSDINKEFKSSMNYEKVDKFVVKVLWWNFGIFFILAVANSVFKAADKYPSPFSWRVMSMQEALGGLVLALIAVCVPAILIGKLKNHYVWRVLVTTCLVVYSYLFVFISGGSIEMHFHFFMIIALLIVYADWRLEWVLLVLTALHHGILNYVEPGWVYFYGRNDFAVITHALPVLGAVIFTTVLCQNHRDAIIALEHAKSGLETTVNDRTRELQEVNTNLEKMVSERTTQLQQKLSEVEKLNKVMVGREVKMAELKKQVQQETTETQGA